MEGHGRTLAAASVAAVIGDDDLLREILLRLGFPHYLVRAALVSKRWLLQASDPAFLRCFRERHPPRLLGFSIDYAGRSQLVPLPQHPELAAISSRAASSCDNAFARRRQYIQHCRNGRLISMFLDDTGWKYALLSPLLVEESELVLPPTPTLLPHNNHTHLNWWIYLPEDGGRDGITFVRLWRAGRKVSAEVYVLGSGGWGVPSAAVTEIELPYPITGLKNMLYPVHGKIFTTITVGHTLGLDLSAARFFILEHPDGVGSNFMLSHADSGIYLVNVEGLQVSIWLHKLRGDDYGAGGWLLVDTFCVHEACTHAVGERWVGDCVDIVAVGDNAEFAFLNHAASGAILYVNLRSRVVEKVYDQHDSGHSPWYGYIRISPLMMIWPPVFPALNR
ncbi:hypothetical protein ACQ4PT_063358 [Festuca glaucescens]